ncbi:unnamed protein product [Thlaspi arvense]|uniref:Pentatricopeptide repeat-containing protein n=1 Tax=Thlaspi arvense TaxID=13288 RepID=A0AAU9TAC7_THLAR|nr:unnamed protein product [Thlaspi arvense]
MSSAHLRSCTSPRIHSNSGNPSRVTQLSPKSRPHGLQDALCLFNRMLLTRPLPSIFHLPSGYSASVVTFNTLMNGLILEDRTFEAIELFKKLTKTREIVPDSVTYGIIINGLCRTGNVDRAVRLLRVMEETNCKPSVLIYNTVIDNLCKDRMIDEALNLFAEMKEKDICPDVITYNSLLHGGLFDEAKELFLKMKESGCLPDEVTYNTIVRWFIENEKYHEALQLLE